MQPVLAVVAQSTKEKKERLMDSAIAKNGLLATKLCEALLKEEEAQSSVMVVPDGAAASNNPYADFSNVVLHVSRDWGNHSKSNYNQAILDATAKYVLTLNRELRILVPGCGCGGLLSDLVALAKDRPVHITATETSKTFLAFLRAIIVPNNNDIFFQGDLLPFAHVLQDAFYGDERDQFLPVRVTVRTLPSSMVTVLETNVFRSTPSSQYDAVITSFVLDAVEDPKNLIDSLAGITSHIKPGGIWINYGPCHYHNEKLATQLSYSDLVRVMVDRFGYEVLQGPAMLPLTSYTRDFTGGVMFAPTYKPGFSVLRKK